MEFPRAAPSGIPQTSLGFRGHLITNFPHIPHIMVLLIIIPHYSRRHFPQLFSCTFVGSHFVLIQSCQQAALFTFQILVCIFKSDII